MKLEQVIADYHAILHEADCAALYQTLSEGLHARRMLVGKQRDRLACSVLRPRLITEQQYATLLHASALVGSAIQRVGRAALGEPALLEPYALNATEHALLAIDPGYPGASAFGRLDGFLAADGSACWFVESNLESPAGIAYDEGIAEIFDQMPCMAAFRQHYTAEALPVRQGLQQLLLDTYRAWGGTDTPTIAIVDFPGVVTWSEFEHLRDRFVADGIPTILAGPDALEYRGGKLYAHGTAITLVYRRILQHEFLREYDLSHPLIRAYADRAVCVVNPFRSKPVHTKLIMWLLSDPDGPASQILAPAEFAALAAHVPWTRRVQAGQTRYQGDSVDLLAFASARRDQLVLKPNDEYGGQGVLLGWETDPLVWEQALVQAQASPWVLQERVPVPVEAYPTWRPDEGLRIADRYVDSDPLVYGEQVIGCLTRIASTALLNVSAGGGSAPPTFLVRTRESS